MRFMIIRRADKDTEAGAPGSEELFAAMGAYHEEMVKAGLVRAAEGLQPTSKGVLVKFSKGVPTVIDGPFSEAKELIAGFTIIEVALEAGGDRVGEALARAGRKRRSAARGPPDLRDGRLRRRVHARAARREERMREQVAATGVGPGRAIATPYLSVPDANAAIAFYAGGFGAVERFRLPHEDGVKTMHAEIEIAGAKIFLSDMGPAPKPTGVGIALGFENAKTVDAVAARAKEHGATINVGPEDMFWGDRFAELTDPFGHTWMLTAPKDS